jgi:triacylglycerol lipase
MAPLGLVGTGLSPANAPPGQLATPQLLMEETLTCGRRLWIRGYFAGPIHTPGTVLADHSWWPWRRRKAEPSALPRVKLETRVSSQLLETEISLQPGEWFEATLEADLPPARRGWRIARHKATCAGISAEKCGVVLTAPEAMRGAVVVILPLACAMGIQGAQQLTRSVTAQRLTPILCRLQQAQPGLYTFSYLACVPIGNAARSAELALAMTTLGWPTGNLVLLPVGAGAITEAVLSGVDRLRWLAAGHGDVHVLNLEPTVAPAAAEYSAAKPDRAEVRSVIHPDDDPASVFAGSIACPPVNHSFGLRRTRAGLVPRYPIVFCHGMLAMSTLHGQVPEVRNYFSPLGVFLRDRGLRVLFPEVGATSGVVDRAKQLQEQIRRWTSEPINLIAHSMGGLDARYLITHLGMAERVRGLTTIATPHRGSYTADWFVANYRHRVPLMLALEALGMNLDGFRDCETAACRGFNSLTPDRPEVHYFSYGAAVSQAHVSPMLRRSWSLITAVEGPNDGLVSVASARWGTYLGTLHVDHFGQTPDMVFTHPAESFDALGFYVRLLQDLARRGF